MKEKSQVADIDRSVYDIRDKEDDAYRMQEGLTPEIIDRLSKEKGDPVWMQQFRLQSLQIYNEMPIPDWGPSIEGLDMDHIATYVRPKTDMKSDWKDVPQDIKDTFDSSRGGGASSMPGWWKPPQPKARFPSANYARSGLQRSHSKKRPFRPLF